jgi:hypothetical protein
VTWPSSHELLLELIRTRPPVAKAKPAGTVNVCDPVEQDVPDVSVPSAK